MRKTRLFFAVIISVTFFSCKKENANDPARTSKVKTYTEDYTLGNTHIVYTFNLNYDSEGRLVSMVSTTSQGDRFEYAYQNGEATLDIFHSNAVTVHENFYLNNNSQVDSTFQYNDTNDSTSEKYFYNGKKQIIKMIEYTYSNGKATADNVTNYTYDATGNLISEVDYYSQTTYDYYPDLSYHLNLGLSFLPETINLVKTTTVSYGTTQVVNHSYTFDSNSRLSTEKAVGDNGEIVIKTYTY